MRKNKFINNDGKSKKRFVEFIRRACRQSHRHKKAQDIHKIYLRIFLKILRVRVQERCVWVDASTTGGLFGFHGRVIIEKKTHTQTTQRKKNEARIL